LEARDFGQTYLSSFFSQQPERKDVCQNVQSGQESYFHQPGAKTPRTLQVTNAEFQFTPATGFVVMVFLTE